MSLVVALFVLGAVGAVAAQAKGWHINGKYLSQQGVRSAGVEATGGSLKLEAPGLQSTFTCTSVNSTGSIEGVSSGEVIFSVSNCQLGGAPQCSVQPFEMAATVSLSALGMERYSPHGVGGSEVFARIVTKGATCSWPAPIMELENPSGGDFGAQAGSEAGNLLLTGSSTETLTTWLGSEPLVMSLSGVSSQHLTGKWAGAKLGAV